MHPKHVELDQNTCNNDINISKELCVHMFNQRLVNFNILLLIKEIHLGHHQL
jgi:hypothetical protein